MDGLWRITAEEFESALSENNIYGALNIDAAYEKLRQKPLQTSDLSM